MFKNELGKDSPITKFKHPKIRRRDGVAQDSTSRRRRIFDDP